MEKLNNFTIKHLANGNSSSKNDTISSVNNILSNMSVSHAYGYHPDDDKTINNSGAHSLPVVAPAEPKSKHHYKATLSKKKKKLAKQMFRLIESHFVKSKLLKQSISDFEWNKGSKSETKFC